MSERGPLASAVAVNSPIHGRWEADDQPDRPVRPPDLRPGSERVRAAAVGGRSSRRSSPTSVCQRRPNARRRRAGARTLCAPVGPKRLDIAVAMANHSVVTACVTAAAFLDLPRRLGYLKTLGVPVVGWQHDWISAFYTRSNGLRVPRRVERAGVVADVLCNRVPPTSPRPRTTPSFPRWSRRSSPVRAERGARHDYA
jgi:Indigoidine synthase A like protein